MKMGWNWKSFEPTRQWKLFNKPIISPKHVKTLPINVHLSDLAAGTLLLTVSPYNGQAKLSFRGERLDEQTLHTLWPATFDQQGVILPARGPLGAGCHVEVDNDNAFGQCKTS